MSARVILCAFLASLTGTIFAGTLQSLKIESHQGKTTVFCGFSNPAIYHTMMLNQPNRFVMDLDKTSTSIDLRHVSLGHGVVSAIRGGHPNPQTLRLVFDVHSKVSPHVSLWHASGKPFGLRIDLNPLNAASHEKNMPVHSVATPTHSVPVKHAPRQSSRDVIVVLDPGHGGKDPGAMGARRHAEKDVVLAIALKLKQQINRQRGMRAVMTRNGDYYIGLRERLDIARKYNADVFIAIHADAFINQQSHGASVFALSQKGATSEAARWLAEKENYSELGGVNLSGLDDQSGMIRSVLIDLSQTATINAGLQMGTYILQCLSPMTVLHNHKVEQARFVVLKSPDIPSVLVETGFISNPNEERNLTNPQYQTRLAQAIFEGVKRYFWEHPIQGTHLEVMSRRNTHLLHAENRPSWFSGLHRQA